jgi:hypothetical protein
MKLDRRNFHRNRGKRKVIGSAYQEDMIVRKMDGEKTAPLKSPTSVPLV